ncbi:MAG: excinuclease ABC subunit UvrA [Cytophagales bacterium]|nr:excinuclease ABC subunit UvrA [Cytophagales bacterium]
MDEDIDNLDPKQYIIVKNARVNNLKNLSVAIPKNKLVVITGVSGSGKSSLAFDTLFAEGQRMYVESLNAYARQFLGRMQKPDVDYIKGIAPAIAIEQKVNTKNPRSTVGTVTEIYDYLKLLYARIGRTYSPKSGVEVRKDTVTDVVNWILTFDEGDKLYVLAPFKLSRTANITYQLETLIQKGYTRLLCNDTIYELEDLLKDFTPIHKAANTYILVDRTIIHKSDDDAIFRLSDSILSAFNEGEDTCEIQIMGKQSRKFSALFEADGIKFEEPGINFFTFNNPYGACKHCDGFGHVLGIDIDKVIPNKNLSVYEGAIAPWKGEVMSEWLKPLVANGIKFDFPIHRPYNELNAKEKKLLWDGNEYFEGLHTFFKYLERETYKIQYRVMLSRYRGRTVCPECLGTRLRKDAQYVKISGVSITDVVLMPVAQAHDFFNTLNLTEYEHKVGKRVLAEIVTRLYYLEQVGLGYLTLNRIANTLSGGEFQRIKLATTLGSALVGSLYILDEPSIGLHPRDTQKLVNVLLRLRDIGNTVIVVEHEEEVMRTADIIFDIGPDAGSHGGHLVNAVLPQELNQKKYTDSHTVNYLSGIDKIMVPKLRRAAKHFIRITGASENNLKNITAKVPLNTLTVVTGVSGSGKSTLIKKIFYPAISKIVNGIGEEFTGKFEKLEGPLSQIKQVEFVDQNPIGKSSRSNPVSYIKAYDAIRNLYAEQTLAKQRGYKPSHFSFNVEGGRCETCQGEGHITIEMQFMADIHILCESCHGKRFKQDILEVTYKNKDISDVLDMTVDDAIIFFGEMTRVCKRLMPLAEVGLGYIKLGQSSNTLSGGEAQRVKLASFIGEGSNMATGILFIFDEPTTGLHFHDINKLLTAVNTLVNAGNTVVIIEHNVEVIKCADWIIDLGPEGGQAGGHLCFEGTPEQMIKLKDNFTAKYLKNKLAK